MYHHNTNNHSGFTIVELATVVMVLLILSVLGVSSFDRAQANARDIEREEDISSIARHLESIYKNGLPEYSIRSPFGYPGTGTLSLTSSNVEVFLSLGPTALRTPGTAVTDPQDLLAATNASQSASTVAPSPAFDEYVYQPITAAGGLCSDGLPIDRDCVKFNLYYRTETDNEVKMKTSLNQ